MLLLLKLRRAAQPTPTQSVLMSAATILYHFKIHGVNFASVVKLLSCSASNGEFAGESPAGCAIFYSVKNHQNLRSKFCRVSPISRGVPLRTGRLRVRVLHAAPISKFQI